MSFKIVDKIILYFSVYQFLQLFVSKTLFNYWALLKCRLESFQIGQVQSITSLIAHTLYIVELIPSCESLSSSLYVVSAFIHYISITFIYILTTLTFGISFISHRSSSISSNVSPIELSVCLMLQYLHFPVLFL